MSNILIRTVGLAFLTCTLGFSQATTATLDGTIHDQTGAVVPGAKVTVHNMQTGVSSTVDTNAVGNMK